ncbi:hypothetical protein Goari_024080 [Gossypium aridum]|uniref:Uncharacterized protein n=1 Tax=Gossypium aridum TaxID=34290 RepID=A0A7J8X4Z6_GOSAI|nr:hypothetical protein [Gossypium aridum]
MDKYLFRTLAQIQVNKAYSRVANVPTILKRLMNITGMNGQWVAARMKQKRDSKCIPWKSLKDLILVHPDAGKRVDVFALSIYGLVIFPKALGHKVEKFSYRVFSENYSPLKKFMAIQRQDNFSEEKWMAILQSLKDEDDMRVVGYALLLVLRQNRSRQFIPVAQWLAQCEFAYKVILETTKNLPTEYRYGTRCKTKAMDQMLKRLEQIQKDMQDQLQTQLQDQLAKV